MRSIPAAVAPAMRRCPRHAPPPSAMCCPWPGGTAGHHRHAPMRKLGTVTGAAHAPLCPHTRYRHAHFRHRRRHRHQCVSHNAHRTRPSHYTAHAFMIISTILPATINVIFQVFNKEDISLIKLYFFKPTINEQYQTKKCYNIINNA